MQENKSGFFSEHSVCSSWMRITYVYVLSSDILSCDLSNCSQMKKTR